MCWQEYQQKNSFPFNQRALSGEIYHCSECDYTEFVDIEWKPWSEDDLERDRKFQTLNNNTTWIGLDHFIIPKIKEKYPEIFKIDWDQPCKTCKTSRDWEVHGLLTFGLGSNKNNHSIKDWDKRVLSVSHCTTCGEKGPSCGTGTEVFTLINNLLD